MLAIIIRRTDLFKKVLSRLKSMRFTMVATYLAVILITLVVMSVYTLGLLEDNLYRDEAVDMFTKANIIAEGVSGVWNNDPEVSNDIYRDVVESSLAGTNIRGAVTNISYVILYDTNTDASLIGKVFMRDVLKDAINGEQTQMIEQNESGATMMSIAVPVKVNGEIIGCVYLAQNIKSIDNTIRTTRTSMVFFSVIIVLLIGMLSFGMSYIITSPFERFRVAVSEISKGNFSVRMKISGHNEIAAVCEAFNYMCEELDHLEEQRRKFVSDASHELKTPMAGIKLICDSIVNADNIDMETVKDFLSDMSVEVERLTRIIERLLALTRLNSGGDNLRLAETDINMMISHIVKKLTPLADNKDIVIYADYNVNRGIALDYDKIYEAIYNICDNAVKYTENGGFVHVKTEDKGEYVSIEIEDNGPGIPEEEKDKIFDRFYRLDDSHARDTGGTGLGLAIARESILMHGGKIEVETPKAGGSIFKISIPYVFAGTQKGGI